MPQDQGLVLAADQGQGGLDRADGIHKQPPIIVGNAVPGVPSGVSRSSVQARRNLPIEVKFRRGNAGDGVPYGYYQI